MLIKHFQGFQTQPTAPSMFTKIGSILSITNESVSMNIRPPLRLNGDVTSIILSLALVNISNVNNPRIVEIYRDQSLRSPINSHQLMSILNNITLTNLNSDQAYSIKSRFCSIGGCVWTNQEIKFKTLVKDQLVKVKLRPHAEKQSFIINWDLLSDKLAQNDERVVYQLKGASSRGLIDTIIYEGTDREVLLKNLIPYKNYTFEILAFYRGDKSNTIIDRKLVSFQTSSDGEY